MNEDVQTIANLDWNDPIREEIDKLDQEINLALTKLTNKQKLAVKAMAAGESQTKALVMAGYSKLTAHKQGKAVMGKDGVQYALKLLQRRYTLASGWTPEWKRRQMEDALYRAKLEENHARSATAQDKVLRTMLEYDGDIKQGSESAGNVQIVINTGLDAPGVTIDGTKNQALIDADH